MGGVAVIAIAYGAYTVLGAGSSAGAAAGGTAQGAGPALEMAKATDKVAGQVPGSQAV